MSPLWVLVGTFVTFVFLSLSSYFLSSLNAIYIKTTKARQILQKKKKIQNQTLTCRNCFWFFWLLPLMYQKTFKNVWEVSKICIIYRLQTYIFTVQWSIQIPAFPAAWPVSSHDWLVVFQTDFLLSVVVDPQSVLCCIMFSVSDMGALLWRSRWGQWGYDRFAHHHDDDWPTRLFKHCKNQKVNTLNLYYCFLFWNLLPFSFSVSPLAVWTLFFGSALSSFILKKTSFSSIKSFQSHDQRSHEKIYLLDLIQFDRLQSLEMKSSTLALISALFLSLDWLLRCDLRGWPAAPRGPPSLALRWPRTQLNIEQRPDKRANIPCSPLMSPAKRTGSTLGPLGFIYPFFLALQRVDWGVKFVRCLSCDRLTTSHTHTAFHIPKELHVAFSWFTLSVFIFSVSHWSVMFEKDSWQE